MAALPTSAHRRAILDAMEPTRWQAVPLATGVHVHVTDASPRGFFGRVASTHAGVVTVVRDDTGGRALVDLSRRRVSAVDR
jgi:hypothetical protein